jgi:hypothetical protein
LPTSAGSSRYSGINAPKAQVINSRLLQQLGEPATVGVALPRPSGSTDTHMGTAPTTLAGLLASLAGNLVLWDNSGSAGGADSISTIPSNEHRPHQIARSPSAGAASVTVQVLFEPPALSNVSLRLPQPPRSFQVLVCSSSSGDEACNSSEMVCSSYALAYQNQTIDCRDMIPGVNYTAIVLDSGGTSAVQTCACEAFALKGRRGFSMPIKVLCGMRINCSSVLLKLAANTSLLKPCHTQHSVNWVSVLC